MTMSKMMIYHAVAGAELVVGATEQNIWGTDMLVKTIDPTDEQTVNEHKADGWHKHPQEVIDEVKTAQKADLTTQLAEQTKVQEYQATIDELRVQVEALTADNAKLTAELDKLKSEKATPKPKKVKDEPKDEIQDGATA